MIKSNVLRLAVLAFCGLAMQSCDDDKLIPVLDLPIDAQVFLETHFPNIEIIRVEKEGANYSVDLAARVAVDFDKNGDWLAVDAADGLTIPTGFIKPNMLEYVQNNYPQNSFNGIEKEVYGFDVELVQGDVDLVFDKAGTFVRVDL